MKMRLFISVIITYLAVTSCLFASNEHNDRQESIVSDKSTMKIIERHKLQNEGEALAKRGEYDAALKKYQAAMNPALLNYDYEKGVAESATSTIYKRQGKLEEALRVVDFQLSTLKNEKSFPDGINGYERAYNKHLEILALIKVRDTNSTKPIYDYIMYIKSKYAEYFPPRGYVVGFSDSRIDDLIHLYDYLHDYDAGIAFLNEIIKYHTQHLDKNHRSANAKHVKEYTRVKEAWELDKKTGQHGHLQEVIRTSDVISW